MEIILLSLKVLLLGVLSNLGDIIMGLLLIVMFYDIKIIKNRVVYNEFAEELSKCKTKEDFQKLFNSDKYKGE